MQPHFRFALICFCLSMVACGGGGGANPATAVPVVATLLYSNETGVFAIGDDGNNFVQLSRDFKSGDRYIRFFPSPDRRWVAIIARLDGVTRNELYLAAVDGSSFAKISVLNNAFSEVSGPNWSPNSNALLYMADDTQDGNTEVYLVQIASNGTPTPPQKINGSIGGSGSVFIQSPAWSYDGSHVAYRVHNRVLVSRSIGVNTHEVGTQSSDPTFSVRVTKPAVASINGGNPFMWSPVENKLAYIATARTPTPELLWVGASEDEATYTADSRIISVLTGGEVVSNFRWSGSGRYIAYVISESSNTKSLNSYDSQTASPNATLLVNVFGNLGQYQWLPGRNRIALIHYNSTTNTTHELTTIDADGNNRADIPTTDPNLAMAVAPNGSSIAAAIFPAAAPFETSMLFASPNSATPSRRVDLNGLRVDGALATSHWSPDGRALAFHVLNTTTFNRELYLLSPNDNNSAIPISRLGDFVNGGPRWSPHSNRVCYLGSGIQTVHCANPDGSNSVIVAESLGRTFSRDFTF